MPITGTIDYDTSRMSPAERAALAVLIIGTGSASSAALTPAPQPAPVPVSPPIIAAPAADPFFSAQPADAQFPSPENSRVLRDGDAIEGKPYLLDATGAVHRLVPVAPACTTGYTINGNPIGAWSPTVVIALLEVRQGQVFAQQNGGQWALFDPQRGSLYNDDLPPAWVGGVPPPPAAPAAPVAVAPSPIAPGSNGTILTAGPGQIAAVLAIAKDGDTLVLDGRYAEDVPTIAVALKVELRPGTVLDFTDQKLAQGKGGFVPLKDFWLDGPGTIMGAGIKEAAAGGTAAVRPGAACNVRITGNPTLTGNQNGLGIGDFPGTTLDVDGLTLDGNGLGDGYTHNAYIFGNCARATVANMVSRNARVGHEWKTRCPDNTFTGCTFEDGPPVAGADDSSVIDLPDGGKLAMIYCTIAKPAGAANHVLIGLSPESGKNGPGLLTMTGGTLHALCDSPLIAGANGATATFSSVAVVGTKPVGQGVAMAGLG